jgi:uncharacterized protein (UPF0333 family)
MFIYLNKRGQSTLEYGIIIAVIVAALITIQVYLKRGIQGKMKSAADDIGEQFSTVGTVNITTTTNATTYENITGGNLTAGKSPKTITDTQQIQNRTSNVTVGNYTDEYWPQ